MTGPSLRVRSDPDRLQKIFCALVFLLSVGLGISIGYSQRTPEFNPTVPSQAINSSLRILTVSTSLISVDAGDGTMIIDWSILSDSACDTTKSPPCPGITSNSSVDIFFDANILRGSEDRGDVPSNNQPDTPIFRHNATAVYTSDVRNALSSFRTSLALFSNIKGKRSLSTLQMYPFDEYSAQIFVYAIDSQTGLIGLTIGTAHGVAVGFQAIAERTPLRGYPGVISETITISRSPLLKAYVLIIVSAVWLLTLMFMFVTVFIVCGHEIDVNLLLIPVATLFSITQLRDSMPGAPPGFGAIIDFVGILPCLALTSFSAILCIATVVFTSSNRSREPVWSILFRKTLRKQAQDEEHTFKSRDE